MASIDDVKQFWENNPLFSGESRYKPGTFEFFEEHKNVYYNDVFAGNFDHKLYLPNTGNGDIILDLGCGAGFWTIELLEKCNCYELHASDITQAAIDLTKKRLEIYNYDAILSLQNAEKMTFPDNFFNHINCQGVIHHTPDYKQAIKEIHRILKTDGTANISVYYKNIILRIWPYIGSFHKILYKIGGGLKGRGREQIFLKKDIDEIVRVYDGENNPVGRAFSFCELEEIINPYFIIEKKFLNFFPARSLPFPIPKSIHRFLSRFCGFMIHLNLRKK